MTLSNGILTAPVSRQQMWNYINSYSADIFATGELRLVIVDNASGNAVGAIDLCDFSARDRRAFVGIAIDSSCRRQGFELFSHHAVSARADGCAHGCAVAILMKTLSCIRYFSNSIRVTCGCAGA